MSSTLTIDGSEYITAVKAGKQFGYTKDYFLMLAKQGKIEGQKINNRWYINPTSAELFFKENEKRKAERSERVRQERREELQKHSQIKKRKNQGSHARAALVETLVIVIIGCTIGATGYFSTSSQIATVRQAEYGFFEKLAVSVYELFTPQQTTEHTFNTTPQPVDSEEPPPTTPHQITHTSLVIAPDEVFTATTVESIQDSFSDEVEISVDPNNPDTGIIIPKFRDREGDAYRFLMVPVNQNTQ